MSVFPTKLERAGANQLLIEWNDSERRLYSAGELRDVLVEGSRKAQAIAQETMERVRSAVQLKY